MNMNIGVIIPFLHGFLGHQHILRLTGGRVNGTHGDHAPDLEIRVDLVSGLHRQSAGNQLIVSCLVHDLLFVVSLLVADAGITVNTQFLLVIGLVVDLIKGHPVFYFVLVPLKAGHGKPQEKVNALPVPKPAVLLHQMEGHLKMT